MLNEKEIKKGQAVILVNNLATLRTVEMELFKAGCIVFGHSKKTFPCFVDVLYDEEEKLYYSGFVKESILEENTFIVEDYCKMSFYYNVEDWVALREHKKDINYTSNTKDEIITKIDRITDDNYYNRVKSFRCLNNEKASYVHKLMQILDLEMDNLINTVSSTYLVKISEYAKIHNVKESAVRRKISNGDFESAQKIGRDWVLDKNEAYVDRRKKESFTFI